MEFSQNNLIEYNGKMYYFYVAFSSTIAGEILLELKNIQMFKIENKLNDLVINGEITFNDLQGLIDRLLSRQDVICLVIFHEIVENNDNNTQVRSVNYNEYFNLVFIVNSILIIERKNEVITYNIQLVHSNNINFLKNINYSTYDGNSSKNIVKILTNCFLQAGLNVKPWFFNFIMKSPGKKFLETKCNIEIDYITNANDNLFTVTNYLLDKLLYYADRTDESIKFIAYNILHDTYSIIDLDDSESIEDLTECSISFFLNSTESMLTETPINLATITGLTTIDSYESLFKSNFIKFDYEKNEFIKLDITNKKLKNLLNKISDYFVAGGDKAYNINLKNIDVNIEKNGSYWNNNYSIYSGLVSNLLELNALVVNMPGRISTLLGSVCNVIIDRTLPSDDEFDKLNAKVDAERYKGFEGNWNIGKITFIIQPNDDNKFSQNLTLFRNRITRNKATINYKN